MSFAVSDGEAVAGVKAGMWGRAWVRLMGGGWELFIFGGWLCCETWLSFFSVWGLQGGGFSGCFKRNGRVGWMVISRGRYYWCWARGWS